MSTDLETSLRDTGADLHLSRPVDDVLARGHRMRLRRGAVRAVATSTLVAAVGLGVAWPYGETARGPAGGPQAAADQTWGLRLVSMDQPDLGEAEALCYDGWLDGIYPPWEDMTLAAASTQGRLTAVIFTDQDTGVICQLLDVGTDHAQPLGSSDFRLVREAAGSASVLFSSGTGAPDEDAADLAVVGATGPGVEEVTVSAGDETVRATVGDGFFAAWLDGPVPEGESVSVEIGAPTP